jgi:hypothetical protein
MDDGQCEEGVVLFENDGSRFDGGEICDWCDYLVVHDNRASQEKCGASVRVEFPTLQTLMPLVADAAKHVSIPFAGDTLVVPGIATADWWDGVTQGSWEPSTWRTFNQEVPSEGTYVGFGEWCGVTGLFGMQRAA